MFKPLTVNTPVGEKAHILAEDDAVLYDGIFGEDCVLKLGEQFASKTISNNVIRIMDGVVVVGGHVGRIIKGDYEDMMIDNGTADQKRNDLIVARFQSGGTGGTDTYSLIVVKGTPGATAKDPAIVQEDLYAGGKQRDYPLYRVRIENLSVVGVDKLFQVNSNFKALAEAKLDKTGESSNTTVVFQDASSQVNLTSGEKLSVLFGKISKWLKDLNTVCFTGSYNDLSNRPNLHAVATSGNYNQLNNRPTIGAAASRSVVNNATTTSDGTVLDGRMGKSLKDLIDAAKNRITALEGYRSWVKIGYTESGTITTSRTDFKEYLVFIKFNATDDTEGIVTINIPKIAPAGYYFDGYFYSGGYAVSVAVDYKSGNSFKLLQSWCAITRPNQVIKSSFRLEVYGR